MRTRLLPLLICVLATLEALYCGLQPASQHNLQELCGGLILFAASAFSASLAGWNASHTRASRLSLVICLLTLVALGIAAATHAKGSALAALYLGCVATFSYHLFQATSLRQNKPH